MPMRLKPTLSDNVWDRIYSVVKAIERPSILEWGSGGSTMEFADHISVKGGHLRSIEHGFAFYQVMEKALLESLRQTDLTIEKRLDFDSARLKLSTRARSLVQSKIQQNKNLVKRVLGRPYITSVETKGRAVVPGNWLGVWENPVVSVGQSAEIVIKGHGLKEFRPHLPADRQNNIFDWPALHFQQYGADQITVRVESQPSNYDGFQQLQLRQGSQSLWCNFGLMPALDINVYDNAQAATRAAKNQTIVSTHKAGQPLEISTHTIANDVLPFITVRIQGPGFDLLYEYRPWVNHASGFGRIGPGETFDLIFLDSKEPTRMQCLDHVFKAGLLKPKGHIIIHDAHRYAADPIFHKWLKGGQWMDGSGKCLNGPGFPSGLKKEAYFWQAQ